MSVGVSISGCNAVWTCRYISTFRRNTLPPSSGILFQNVYIHIHTALLLRRPISTLWINVLPLRSKIKFQTLTYRKDLHKHSQTHLHLCYRVNSQLVTTEHGMMGKQNLTPQQNFTLMDPIFRNPGFKSWPGDGYPDWGISWFSSVPWQLPEY
jgi:hypothetical protein